MQKRHWLTPMHERMRVERCRHLLNLTEDGMLPNWVYSDEKKFDVEQCVNHQNDRVWGRNTSVEGRRVSRRQNPTSVMVWFPAMTRDFSDAECIFNRIKHHAIYRKISPLFEESGFEILDWPGNSPDINPIENIEAISNKCS